MATIYNNLGEEERAAFADLNVGDLLLVRTGPGHRGGDDDDGDGNDDEERSDSESSDAEGSDEEVDSVVGASDEQGDNQDGEDAESEAESDGVQTPQAAAVDVSASTAPELVNEEHALHIENVDDANEPSANDDQEANEARDQSDGSDLAYYPPTMFVVCKVVKNSEGEVEKICTVSVDYSAHPSAQDDDGTYQLYGKQCVANMSTAHLSKLAAEAAKSAEVSHSSDSEAANPRSLMRRSANTIYTARPDADEVRRILFNYDCPVNCNDGWLSIDKLRGMVKDYTVPTAATNVAAVCPSCIGIDIMKEHQQLRADLEAFQHVGNFTSIIDFYARLNPRRRELEYDFNQFDEREWGYYFDDMLSEDGNDINDGGNDERYESWDEANDPANGAQLRPASEATIKSLPVEKYATVKTEDNTLCIVCHEDYQDEQLVVVLPCKHFFCEDCCKQWLQSYDNCPACRARVPAAAGDTPDAPIQVNDATSPGETADSPIELDDDGVNEGEDGEGFERAASVAEGDAEMTDTE
ncbi:hypothetical protein Q7P37_007702 [Cladosporium fusiforme]